jgi:N-acetylglucosamine kinase-like BadF-type ATPase
MESKFYIGVDGGGTKTHLAVANANGELIDFAESSCTNWELEAYSFENWLQLFNCISGKSIETAVFTVSGWDFEIGQQQTRMNIERALRQMNITIKHSVYKNDVYSLYKSGIGESTSGVAVASGTGTIGLAVDGEKHFQTTGYGYISGEWGSGFDIVEYALHLVCSSLLGREENYPELIGQTYTYFNATDLESLVKRIVGPEFKTLNPGYFLANIYKAFYAGCPGARKTLEKASSELAQTTWSLLKKIGSQKVPVIFGGGTFKNFGLPFLLKEKLCELTQTEHEFRIVKSDPVYGAILWALQLDKRPLKQVYQKIIIE